MITVGADEEGVPTNSDLGAHRGEQGGLAEVAGGTGGACGNEFIVQGVCSVELLEVVGFHSTITTGKAIVEPRDIDGRLQGSERSVLGVICVRATVDKISKIEKWPASLDFVDDGVGQVFDFGIRQVPEPGPIPSGATGSGIFGIA